MSIRLVTTEPELRRAFVVLSELRPQLSEEAFVAQVGRQLALGWRLAVNEEQGVIVACAGYRISEWLAWGKALYVDDLVTTAAARSLGHGDALFRWLVEEARREGCAQLHLDSGVQRFGAHRFYLRHRMDITSHHFALRL
jgi:GNAT superfamily N-acetyltransferase